MAFNRGSIVFNRRTGITNYTRRRKCICQMSILCWQVIIATNNDANQVYCLYVLLLLGENVTLAFDVDTLMVALLKTSAFGLSSFNENRLSFVMFMLLFLVLHFIFTFWLQWVLSFNVFIWFWVLVWIKF